MNLIDGYIDYIGGVKRYSPRTLEIYRGVLENFAGFMDCRDDDALAASMKPVHVRSWEVGLLDDGKLSTRTVNLYLSVLSSFAKYLISRERLKSNPVTQVKRPKVSGRLPVFYRQDAMEKYFASTRRYADGTMLELYADAVPLTQEKNPELKNVYESVLRRMIVSLLYATALRRAELISLNVSSVDFPRSTIRVVGKGDKMREIPLTPVISGEISLYLNAVELMVMSGRQPGDPLLVTATGGRLYPEYVDRAVKTELGAVGEIKGRRSPHVLRHTLATELLENGSDLNSIKELLGHSSLAATQVYTHNSVAKLKSVYESAHPRAKKGGNYGD